MHESLSREISILVEHVRIAGRRALDCARDGFDVQTKTDRSPVTTADLEVNRILFGMQQEHFPDDGWLSEESPDDHVRLRKARVWIVDPIDGTKAFVNRVPEFCISAALVEKGEPILGAIFNPSTDELFTAVRGEGFRLNGLAVEPPASTHSTPTVMVSPWEFRSGRWSGLDGMVHCRPMLSIANALALVAFGRVQATMTIEPENEWDLAAGVLLIRESGGTIADAAGHPFTFNHEIPRFRGVIAVSAGADATLRPLLQAQADEARKKRRSTF